MRREARNYLRAYLFLLGARRRSVPLMVLRMLVLAGLDLVGVGLVAPFMTIVTTGEIPLVLGIGGASPQVVFWALSASLVGVFVVKSILGFRLTRTIVGFSEACRADLVRRLMAVYQNEPWETHLQRNTSESIHRVLWYTANYSSRTLAASLRLLSNSIVCVALIVLLAAVNLVAVAVMVLVLGVTFLAVHGLVRPRLTATERISADENKRVIVGVQQALGAFREIRLQGAEPYFRSVVADAADRLARSSARGSGLMQVPRYSFEVAIVTVVVVLGGVTRMLDGAPAIAVPTLGMFALAGLRLLPAVTSLLNGLNQLRSSRFAVEALAEELGDARPTGPARAPVEATTVPASEPPTPFRSLELKDVGFTYQGAERPALHDVNLTIRAGDALGLMGRSGAGKSTLADVILGLLAPQRGAVHVNGVDIQDDLRGWWRRIAYIPQRVFLLDDTLRANVTIGVPDDRVDQTRLAEALHQAQLDDVVSSLPAGIETMVGEDGSRLSGGQRQRVALARALYQGRDLIVLDEATSALDAETEAAVVESIRGLASSKTLVVIAHRETTLAGCTRYLHMKDGRLEEISDPQGLDGGR